MKRFARFISLLLVLVCFCATIASAEDSTDIHSNIKKLLENTLTGYSSFTIEGNDSGYYIIVTYDGMIDATAAVMVGLKPREDWQRYVDSATNYAKSVQNFLTIAGVKNPNLLFVVMDDYGFNFPLLIISNGVVVYDFIPADMP